MVTLYAWVNPLSATKLLDHTWVTSYNNRENEYSDIDAVEAAGVDYWYCWGIFHPTGSTEDYPDGMLFSTQGDEAFSKCLVEPNAKCEDSDAAKGTIFTYGVDGVCHQLANQVLYGAQSNGVAPLVSDARGYILSSALYGDYGRQHSAWTAQIAACTSESCEVATAGEDEMSDHFMNHVAKVLPGDDEALAQIADFRAQLQTHVTASLGSDEPSADDLNAANRKALQGLEEQIGAEKFLAIFGHSASEAPDLVDPDMLAASRGQSPLQA